MTRATSTAAQKDAIKDTFNRAFGAGAAAALGRMDQVDRIYELRCLIALITALRTKRPSLRFTLSAGAGVTLRAKGGPIDRTGNAGIEVRDRHGPVLAEIGSNVEYLSLSYVSRHRSPPTGRTYARAHELDLVLVTPGLNGRPRPTDILIGVEAKHRPYSKGLLKELLGVRREMAFVDDPTQNPWEWWSLGGLPAAPASGLVAWCAYASITNYTQAADFYGIWMEHLPL